MFFKPQKSIKPKEDIPEALRDQAKVAKSSKLQLGIVIGGLLGLAGMGMVLIGTIGFLTKSSSEITVSPPVTPVETTPEPTPEPIPEPIPEPTPDLHQNR